MEGHIAADAVLGLVNTGIGTAANLSDISKAAHLLHREESIVHADAGSLGLEKCEEMQRKKLD